LLVHVGLLLALTTAVNWRTKAPEVFSAELWASVPQVAAPTPPAPGGAGGAPPPPPAPARATTCAPQGGEGVGGAAVPGARAARAGQSTAQAAGGPPAGPPRRRAAVLKIYPNNFRPYFGAWGACACMARPQNLVPVGLATFENGGVGCAGAGCWTRHTFPRLFPVSGRKLFPPSMVGLRATHAAAPSRAPCEHLPAASLLFHHHMF
jgi:hypothetical protein